MRWLAWTMLLAIRSRGRRRRRERRAQPGAHAPHGSAATPIDAVIVKFRSASHSAQVAQVRPAQERIAAVMARTGLTLRAARPNYRGSARHSCAACGYR